MSGGVGTDASAVRARHAAVFRPYYRQHGRALAVLLLAVALWLYGASAMEVSGTRLLNGIGELGRIVGLMLPPDPGSVAAVLVFAKALAETLAIALLGTLGAAVIAFPLGFLAARNTTVSLILRFFARRSFDTLRGVDILIWALVWINVVGLGPFAGVLALMSSDVGSFGKLFSEAIEAADQKAVEGVLSTGGSRSAALRFGIVPQLLPVWLSQVLYFFESNTRSASIIGIVGAGGVGLVLSEQIRTLEFGQMSFMIGLIWLTVSLIDLACSRLRFAVIGTRAL
jgi:phosphonate transport system permease protein